MRRDVTGEPNVSASLRPVSGPEYFRACLGEAGKHTPHLYGKHDAHHPATIRKVYEEALTRFPEAADVIASLVFFECVERNRRAFLEEAAHEA